MAENQQDDARYEEVIGHYRKIEDSLRCITALQGRTGLLTDWLIISAVQSFDDEGTPQTNTGWHTNPESGVPYHRMLGLVEYAKALLQREVGEDEG